MYSRMERELEDLGLKDSRQEEKYVEKGPASKMMVHPLLGPMLSAETHEELKYETKTKPPIVIHPLLGPMLQEEEEFEYEIIGKEDERKLVINTKEIPFRWICYLKLVFISGNKKLTAMGTGTIIGDRAVLTAGHNLFDHDWKLGWASSVKVVPAKSGNNEPFGSHMAAKLYVPQKYEKKDNYEYDYGLIILNKPFTPELGWWKRIRSLDTERLKNLSVNIAGYPADKKPDYTMWRDFKKIKKVTDRLLFYDLDTYGGMSGSPVWVRWKDYRSIIGIHTGGWRNKDMNRSIRITKDVRANIMKWMKEAKIKS